MPDVSFSGIVIVAAVAFAAPFLLGLFPRVRLPAVVLEIVLGIVIGPSALGWVHPDLVIQVLSVIGLGFLLFVSGLEVELERLRGPRLRLPAAGLIPATRARSSASSSSPAARWPTSARSSS
jgi:Kef-type K+ transport system membrane component KefB